MLTWCWAQAQRSQTGWNQEVDDEDFSYYEDFNVVIKYINGTTKSGRLSYLEDALDEYADVGLYREDDKIYVNLDFLVMTLIFCVMK